ncbi:MAG TPA: winged helix-turn-helix domain-containing protein [Candidatus Nanoarchaeia archaeon]|nr:winged helix-turn-helix domain-containing protein [Candidatus Nanoarchaeia archaeon]
MPRKRGRLDIITDMLATLQNSGGEIKPTHLMYKSNLSHVQMSSYLEELLDKEFIQKVKKKNNDYIIMTDKGFEFFEKLKQMREFEKTFGL